MRLLRDTGAVLSPFNAFLILQGLETLSLRVERHVSNARAIAELLNEHPDVLWVSHPECCQDAPKDLSEKYLPRGAGSIFSFGIKGGRERAARFIDALGLFSHLANVADAKSLIIHPASTTHSQLSDSELAQSGISADSLRLSVGLEHIDDLKQDLLQAFTKTRI